MPTPGKAWKILAILLISANWSLAAATQAQTQTQTDTHVSAELVKGKLNPANSKRGDEIVVRLNEDAKANGQVLLKKGSTIKGVVRKVQRSERKNGEKANAVAQSVIELDWITPGVSGATSQQLNVALQSVIYTNPLYVDQQEEDTAAAGVMAPRAAPRAAPRPTASGGLVSGAGPNVGSVASAASVAGTAGAGIAGTAGAVAGGTAAHAGSRLVTPPAIAPVSAQTSSSLQTNFGVSGNGLFHVGNGQATSAEGTTSSMDLFSHMSNDTVITSPGRDFEISSGAHMQLLVRSSSGSGR